MKKKKKPVKSPIQALEEKVADLESKFKRSNDHIMQFHTILRGQRVKFLPLNIDGTLVSQEYRSEMLLGRQLFSIANSPRYFGPYNSFVNPKINLTDFINYIINIPGYTPDWGFRFYPCWNGSKILFLVTVSQSESANDMNYFLLEHDEYPYDPTLPSFKYSNAVPLTSFMYQIFRDFYSDIQVSGKFQDRNNFSCKRSRFYSWGEISNDYLIRNGVDVSNPQNYEDWNLQLEVGYISDFVSMAIARDFPGEIPANYMGDHNKYHTGFTVIMTILPRVGVNLTDTTFEVGKPCPPDCGSLTW